MVCLQAVPPTVCFLHFGIQINRLIVSSKSQLRPTMKNMPTKLRNTWSLVLSLVMRSPLGNRVGKSVWTTDVNFAFWAWFGRMTKLCSQ